MVLSPAGALPPPPPKYTCTQTINFCYTSDIKLCDSLNQQENKNNKFQLKEQMNHKKWKNDNDDKRDSPEPGCWCIAMVWYPMPGKCIGWCWIVPISLLSKSWLTCPTIEPPGVYSSLTMFLGPGWRVKPERSKKQGTRWVKVLLCVHFESHQFQATQRAHSGRDSRTRNRILGRKQTDNTSRASVRSCASRASARSERRWHAESPSSPRLAGAHRASSEWSHTCWDVLHLSWSLWSMNPVHRVSPSTSSPATQSLALRIPPIRPLAESEKNNNKS